MKRQYGRDEIQRDDRSVVTVGVFDGVHAGHQAIIRYLTRRAERQGGRSVVVSFDPHPREVVQGQRVPLLTTVEERADLLEALGLDRFIVVPFTKDFAALSAEAYVEELLVGQIGLQEIVIGYDHKFGRGRGGDSALLERMGQTHGFMVDVISPQEVEQYGVVSSSAIRRVLLDEGDAEQAAQMLGRPYQLSGVVVEGDRRGRQIGFPTANLKIESDRKLVPKGGVYAVQVGLHGEASSRAGMMNIGTRPTFAGREMRVEVHLLDFEGDLYGAKLHVEFVRRLRDERPFDSVEALAEQLSQDEARCRRALAALP